MSTRFGREMLDYRQQRQQRQQQQQQLQQTLATPTHGKRHTGGRGQPAGSQPGGPSPRCGRRHARQPRRPARRCRPRGAVGGGRAAGAGGRGGAGGAAESAPRAGVDRGEAKAEEVGGGLGCKLVCRWGRLLQTAYHLVQQGGQTNGAFECFPLN